MTRATANAVGPDARSGRPAKQYVRAKRRAKRLYLIAKGLFPRPLRRLPVRVLAKRLYLIVKGLFRSPLNLTGWVLGLGLLVLLFREVTTDQALIQPISVPKSLADDGLTPEVAARRLHDAMNALLFDASYIGGQKKQVSLGGDLPEIVVPTVGMSLSTLAAYVRMFLNLSSRTMISGEVVVSEKKASLVLRLSAREIYRSSEPIPLDRLDKLWSEAAETVLRHISPYHVALSVYDTKPDEAVDIANFLIRYYPATDENVAWAHVILGMHHRDYQRYMKARGEFEAALTIAAKSRWAPLKWIPLSVPFSRPPLYASVAQFTLGSMLLEQGEFKAAVDALNQAVRMDPTDLGARHYLGVARLGLSPKEHAVGDFDEANRLIRKAIHDYDRQGGAGNRGEAKLHLTLGNALQQQDREDAEVEFQQAMRLDPGDFQAPIAYCGLLYEKKTRGKGYDLFNKNYDSCISYFQRAAGDADSQIMLVDYLIGRGKRAEAIEALLSALKHDDRRPQLHAKLGNLYADTKEWDQAVRELSKAIELAPEAAINLHHLGNVYYAKGEFPQAARIYSTVLEYTPSNARYHASRGAAWTAQASLDAAELEYQEAFKLAAQSDTEHNGLGVAFYDKKDFAKAAEAYRRAIDIEPRNALYHANLADALRELKQFDAAVSEHEKAIELDPENADRHNSLGVAFYANRDFAKAAEAYRKAIAIEPSNALHHANLADALRELKQFDAAIKEREKAIELDPENADRHNSLGVAFYEKRDFAKAAEAYRKAIAIEPSNALYHANLALALQELKQFDAAIKEREKAIELDPENADRHNRLGLAFYAKKDFAKAEEAYRKAIAIEPANALYHDKLALEHFSIRLGVA